MTVKEYLESRGAYGADKAVSTVELKNVLHTTDRNVKKMVANERAAGALICSTTAKKGGYYMPASPIDVFREMKKLENGIVKRAAVLAPFRAYCGKHREAEREKKEISLFPNNSK
ncbi:hypothetical protein [uncultured Dialister sp.]|uniref:hypothetical protein n=1 Tax=uncultured Dialister sp. TaxID=278064 RepID=UPI0025D2BA5A|nr:hypothetical protein [uncultured Dialister sp.]